jgi:hypothetical protein
MDCYKDVENYVQRKSSERTPTPKGESLAKALAKIPAGSKMIEWAYRERKQSTPAESGKRVGMDFARGTTGMTRAEIAGNVFGEWLWKNIPDIAPGFVQSRSAESLREIALSESLTTNLSFLQSISASFKAGILPGSDANVLSSTMTTRLLGDLYKIDRTTLDQLDVAMREASERLSVTSPSSTGATRENGQSKGW